MKLKVKKLSPESKLPYRAHPGDAGLDLYARSFDMAGTNLVAYGTGVAVEVPEGHVGLLFPRSSIYKTDLRMSNSVGVIDSGYRGEIIVKFDYKELSPDVHMRRYKLGERIAQLVVVPYTQVNVEEVTELGSSERGVGGFGSSGTGYGE